MDYDWYEGHLNLFASFGDSHGRVRELTVDELQPIHMDRWVDSHSRWKSGKRGAIIAAQRAFNWAARAGMLKFIGGCSPLL